jgi:hypothetical protein
LVVPAISPGGKASLTPSKAIWLLSIWVLYLAATKSRAMVQR